MVKKLRFLLEFEDGKAKTMGNAFYDGCQDDTVKTPTLKSRHNNDRRTYRRILTGFHTRKVCTYIDILSSEKCACGPLISKIILDNPTKSKERLAEMYAVDELGNYNYCFAALIKHFNRTMIRRTSERVRLKASRIAPEGYRVVSSELVQKYGIHDCIVRKDDDSYVQYSKHPPITYLLEIPD